MLYVQHLIQPFADRLVLGKKLFALPAEGFLFFLPDGNAELRGAVFFSQYPFEVVMQVDFILMRRLVFFPPALPMDRVHFINDGLDALDVLGQCDPIKRAEFISIKEGLYTRASTGNLTTLYSISFKIIVAGHG